MFFSSFFFCFFQQLAVGEIYHEQAQNYTYIVDGGDAAPTNRTLCEVKRVSDKMRIWTIEDFLTDEEILYLQKYGKPRMKEAFGNDVKTGKRVTGQFRNNEQSFVEKGHMETDHMIREVLRKMEAVARLPNGIEENMQVGKYGLNQKYDLHYDTNDKAQIMRAVTIIVYLSDLPDEDSGGYTIFPMGARCMPLETAGCCSVPREFNQRPDLAKVIRIAPKKGRALMFFGHDENGDRNTLSLHGACPVFKGEKWIIQQWLRTTHQLHYSPDYKNSQDDLVAEDVRIAKWNAMHPEQAPESSSEGQSSETEL